MGRGGALSRIQWITSKAHRVRGGNARRASAKRNACAFLLLSSRVLVPRATHLGSDPLNPGWVEVTPSPGFSGAPPRRIVYEAGTRGARVRSAMRARSSFSRRAFSYRAPYLGSDLPLSGIICSSNTRHSRSTSHLSFLCAQLIREGNVLKGKLEDAREKLHRALEAWEAQERANLLMTLKMKTCSNEEYHSSLETHESAYDAELRRLNLGDINLEIKEYEECKDELKRISDEKIKARRALERIVLRLGQLAPLVNVQGNDLWEKAVALSVTNKRARRN